MGAHQTANEIVIRGDPDRIYGLAAAVEEWPTFLPHYRWVRVYGREGNRRTVEMAAWRSGIPIRWLSHQWLWPEERRITFQHIGGLSRGMRVEWRIEKASGVRREALVGGSRSESSALTPHTSRLTPPLVRVTITHELWLELPVVRTRAGQWVVGELFVKAVAGRTLACLKQRVEGTK